MPDTQGSPRCTHPEKYGTEHGEVCMGCGELSLNRTPPVRLPRAPRDYEEAALALAAAFEAVMA